MSSYWVRPATTRDAKAVRDLARRVRREFRLGLRHPDRAVGTSAHEHLWVVEAGRGEIVGSCGVREREAGIWDMVSLYLAPEWRGIGLGRALVERAVRAVRDDGGLRVEFTAAPECAQAIALVRQMGFVGQNEPGDVACTFTRILGHPS